MAICSGIFLNLNFPGNQSFLYDYWWYFKIKLGCHDSVFEVLRMSVPWKLRHNEELHVIEKYSNI